MPFCAVCGRSLRFNFRWGIQGLLKRFFTAQYIRQIGSRVIEHMVGYDYAYMSWQLFKLKGYAEFLTTSGDLSIANLDDGQKKPFPHSDAKAVCQPFLQTPSALKI